MVRDRSVYNLPLTQSINFICEDGNLVLYQHFHIRLTVCNMLS